MTLVASTVAIRTAATRVWPIAAKKQGERNGHSDADRDRARMVAHRSDDIVKDVHTAQYVTKGAIS